MFHHNSFSIGYILDGIDKKSYHIIEHPLAVIPLIIAA